MFTLISKLATLTWDSLAGHKVKEKDPGDIITTKIRSFKGKVTSLNKLENYGIINKEVYFNFEVIYANKELGIGDIVFVQVRRKEIHHAWIAYYVELVLTNYQNELVNSKNELVNKHQHQSTDLASQNTNMLSIERGPGIRLDNYSAMSQSPHRKPLESPKTELLVDDSTEEDTDWTETVEQTVSECNRNFGKLKDGLVFDVGSGEIDFLPVIGDVLLVTIHYTDKGKTVVSWKPRELKCIEGEITACENDCGVINNDVVYFQNSCRRKVVLYVGQKVSAMIASSEQGLFKWRAYSLCSSCNKENVDNVRKPCLSHQDGISITEPLDFERIPLGKKNDFEITLQNNTSADLLFQNCYFQNINSVFYISKKPANLSVPENGCFYVTINCKTEAIGQHEDFLLFEFSDFIIKRSVTVTVVDPMQHILKPVAPFKASRDLRDQLNCENLVIIPGRKPYKPIRNFTNKLPPAPIPKPLMRAVQNRMDLYQVFPYLFYDLNMKNYSAKFGTLLHLEEIQVRFDMRKFDLSEAILQRKGEFLSLEVVGLAEGRPSLIVGDKAILVPPHQKSTFAFEGYIHEVHLNEVLLKFNDSFQGTYGGESFDVRFELNRANFRRMHQCVHHVAENHEYAIFPSKLHLQEPLINLRLENSETHVNKRQKCESNPGMKWNNSKLNWKQQEAVMRILESRCRPLPYVIFGPPGTGKTITLVEAVLQVYENISTSRIIICTPSNSAADLVALRIIESNLIDATEMVRFNSYQRSVDSIPEIVRPFCQDKDSLDIVSQYRIIISTCSTAGSLYSIGLCNEFFTHVFIDEAGQLMEPESDIAVGFIDSQTEGQIIMAGDPQQLGPVLRSPHVLSCGLQVSYLERLMKTSLYGRNEKEYKQYGGYNPLLVTMLEESYRSHPDILRFPSDMFYFSQVICRFPTNINHELTNWEDLPNKGFPVIFHGVKGEEFRELNSPSWFNPTEVVQVTKYLQKLYDFGLLPSDVGIIAPYKKQVEKIRMMLSALSLERCKIGSVEEFQGQERRAIIISTVRSSDQYVNCDILYNLGFISCPKRLNVAITRSQELLIVVGNPYVLSKDFYWHSFLRYCVVNKCYTGCELPLSFILNKESSA